MKGNTYMKTPIEFLAAFFASIELADDFKTNEHKSATVTRVEADGIVIKTKGGISKLYFSELPKDVQGTGASAAVVPLKLPGKSE